MNKINTVSIHTLLAAIAASALACGGGGGDNGGDGGGDGPDAGGTADPDAASPAPKVASSPSDGDVGVLIDQPIILTFSEPMNIASVEAAWTSASLPRDQVTFSWNGDNTILTVDASAVLEYPAGGPNVDHFDYDIELDATASDAEGDELDAPFFASFKTARDVTMQLARVDATTGAFDGNATLTDIRIGDTSFNGTYIGFITIDLAELPPVVELTSASMFARQTDVVGTPYTDLGQVDIAHMAPMSQIDFAAYTAVELSETLFSNSTAIANPGGNRSADVTDAIATDLGAGHTVSSFRLRFTDAQDLENDEDHVIFDRTSVRLDVRLLAE